MNATSKRPVSQICSTLQVFLKAHALTLTEEFERLPEARRNEMRRLGSLMWAETQAALEEAQALEAVLAEPAFTAFKALLLAKPKRVRRSKAALQ